MTQQFISTTTIHNLIQGTRTRSRSVSCKCTYKRMQVLKFFRFFVFVFVVVFLFYFFFIFFLFFWSFAQWHDNSLLWKQEAEKIWQQSREIITSAEGYVFSPSSFQRCIVCVYLAIIQWFIVSFGNWWIFIPYESHSLFSYMKRWLLGSIPDSNLRNRNGVA